MNRLLVLTLLVLSTTAMGADLSSRGVNNAPRLTTSNGATPVAPTGDGGIGFMPQRLDFSVVVGHQQALPLTVVNGGTAAIAYTFDASTAGPPPPHAKAIGFTQNASLANTNGGIACADATMSSGSSWWRRFPLLEVPGVAQTLRVRGIELASGTDSTGTFETELHLYTIAHSWPADTISTDVLAEIGSASFAISPGQTLTVPVDATIMGTADLDLVVEWRAPADPAAILFPGSNFQPETHVSFISSTACAIDQPTPWSAFVWPVPSMVMKVHAQQASAQTAFTCQAPSWLVYERTRRGTLAPGASAQTKVSVDTSAMAPGDYDTGICVRSGPAGSKTQSLSIVPVSVHVADPI